MDLQHTHRKDEHLALAEALYRQEAPVSSLNGIRLIHRPLPETTVDGVDLSWHDDNFNWNMPFYIEAMTGGTPRTNDINAQLARAAAETGIAMAVGSESIAIKDPSKQAGFEALREINPDGFMMANIGAGNTLDAAKKAVEILNANALEYHVNVAQELIMPEGDRQFKWLDDLADIRANLDVPVIVKEVGFGFDKTTLAELAKMDINYVSLGGRGGTNFAQIEDRRNRKNPNEHAYLADWGQTTAESLLEAQSVPATLTTFATGGIQTPLDVLKAQVLGARTAGVAGHFLHILMNNDVDTLIAEIKLWQNHLAKLYALVGAQTYDDLANVDFVLDVALKNYAEQRQLLLPPRR